MFTVTDEDRQLRAEGDDWRRRCWLNITQEAEQFVYNGPEGTENDRAQAILRNSFGAILQERTALLRIMFRQNRRIAMRHEVRVLVTERAVEEAMRAIERNYALSESAFQALAYHYMSTDFHMLSITRCFVGTGRGLTVEGELYATFFLALPAWL